MVLHFSKLVYIYSKPFCHIDHQWACFSCESNTIAEPSHNFSFPWKWYSHQKKLTSEGYSIAGGGGGRVPENNASPPVCIWKWNNPDLSPYFFSLLIHAPTMEYSY